jgi:hypothetical protein
MNDSYTVLWTDDRCRWLKEHGATDQPLRVLFGGGHQSAPSFTRFGVRPGDFIYPVRVHRTILHVIARMRVREIIPVGDYLLHHLDCPDVDLTRHLYEVQADLNRLHPELEHRIPWGCVYEAALGEDGMPIRFDATVPPDVLERLRFRSRRGERALKYVEDGKLKRSVGLQGGVYRLSPESAVEFERLVAGARPLQVGIKEESTSENSGEGVGIA